MKKRVYLKIEGAVQGLGFRPFVYQLATDLGLTGWVNNSSEGVSIAIEGDHTVLESFLTRLLQEKPTLAQIHDLQSFWGDAVGYDKFQIKTSTGGEKTALVLPDLATCPECLQDILDPNNHRYCYPFTNCTNCGSRFSIIEALPYDRPNTTMKQFRMCDRCLSEYQNPLDRRFHAQPNACPDCGPHLELWNRQGKVLATHHDGLLATATAIRQGKIAAIKGLGGFHLVVDGRNDAAVKKLRDRKHRPDQPFALMFPNLELVKTYCHVSSLEKKLILSPQAPIVLLRRKHQQKALPDTKLWDEKINCKSPKLGEFRGQTQSQNPYIGVMLPYTPLHHLLTRELGFPIIATSGNFSGEPICIDNLEALDKLNNIADLFLVHNRPILCPIDDSIVQIMGGREQIIRRARGYAPLPINLEHKLASQEHILAVGGQLKNAIAFLKDNRIFLSQYIGDLETVAIFERFQQTIQDFQELYELEPTKVVCDRHSHYLSHNYAHKLNIPLASIQHHYAHVLACMVDNGLDLNEPVLGVAWDGTGYGLDGTIWGGEFLNITDTGFERVAHLRTFSLPGGKQAIKEPARIAITLLYEIYGDQLFADIDSFAHVPYMKTFENQELGILHGMLKQNINTPVTSSMGRLFDGVASILGIRQQVSYEGQAAMELEYAITNLDQDQAYKFNLIQPLDKATNSAIVIDWAEIIKAIVRDINHQLSIAEISAKFHNTLIAIIVAVAKQIGRKQIVLTGGCWQNKYLTEKAIARLKQENFIPYWHQQIPCNDQGIAVGQIIAVLRTINLSC